MAKRKVCWSKIRQRFEAKFVCGNLQECWVWIAYKYPNGYGYFSGLEGYAHRASYVLYKGPIPKGKYVLHHCDNPSCVNPSHLFLGSQTDNMQDMIRKGRKGYTGVCGDRNGVHLHPEVIRGENNGFSTLTEKDVLEIRMLYKRTSYHKSNRQQLAIRFGVCGGTIKSVVGRKSWKHVL